MLSFCVFFRASCEESCFFDMFVVVPGAATVAVNPVYRQQQRQQQTVWIFLLRGGI